MKPEQAQPRVSVVIPVFNGGTDLEKCLAAISASSYPVVECIVVDDASTDDMVIPAAERHGARVIRLDQQCGPAMARNRGAAQARGEILFFTDADVLLHPDALGLAVQEFQANPEISAVFGSYDDQPTHGSFISQYRNLLHHWVHQTSAEDASTFWTGCGAIRRNVFLEMEGFNQDYARPSIEDIELGTRLRKSGHRIRLLKNMHGTHMKRWTFRNMVQPDIFHRGIPWMLLVLRDRQMTNDLNLDYKSRLATVLAGLLGLSLLVLLFTGHAGAVLPVVAFLLAAGFAPWFLRSAGGSAGDTLAATALAILAPLACYWLVPDPMALVPVALVLAIIATNPALYRYVALKRNGTFAIAVAPMQVVFFVCCVIAVPLAYIEHYRGTRRAKTNPAQSDDGE